MHEQQDGDDRPVDHRRWLRDLELVHFEPTSPGMPYWLPRGMARRWLHFAARLRDLSWKLGEGPTVSAMTRYFIFRRLGKRLRNYPPKKNLATATGARRFGNSSTGIWMLVVMINGIDQPRRAAFLDLTSL